MKKFLSILLCIVIVFSLCSCSLLENNAAFTIGVIEAANSFNPMLAKTQAEKILSDNCSEGLLRFDEEGNIDLAGAVAYTIDRAGLTYTFSLNSIAKWHITDEIEDTLKFLNIKDFDPVITSQDYVYGIEQYRKMDADSFSLINQTRALDDFTLQITLTEPDSDFLYKLAALPVFPCERSFYEKLGNLYGKSIDRVLTNGPYYIKEATPSEIVLERSSDYTGNLQIQNPKILLYVTGAEESLKERFINENYNTFITNNTTDLPGYKPSFISTEMVWGLAFNCQSKIGRVQGLRYVLFNAIDFECIPIPEFATGKATSIIPKNFSVCDSKYSDFSSTPLKYNANGLKASVTMDEIRENFGVGTYAITFAVPEEMEGIANKIIKDWKDVFGEKVGVTLTTFKMNDAPKIAAEGSYDIAILPVNPYFKTALSVINSFSSAPCYYENDKLSNISQKLSPIPSESCVTFRQAEEIILNNSVFVPLFYTGKALYLNQNFSGVYLADGGKMLYFHAGAEK